MKFTIGNLSAEAPIELSLVEESDGDVRLEARTGVIKVELLRVTTDGRLVRILGQVEKLKKLGFKIDQQTVHVS